MAFDLGVLLTVTGATVVMLNAIVRLSASKETTRWK
jgi:hypothetical protein